MLNLSLLLCALSVGRCVAILRAGREEEDVG